MRMRTCAWDARPVNRSAVETNAMAPSMLLVVAAVVAASSHGPFRGWRSWNQMGPAINQTQHEAIAAALADRSRLVDGKPTSLLDLGFDRIGMDDNWQACGAGINGSFHAADGTPLWNTTRFPDVRAMNEKIHRLGLKSDWCKTAEPPPPGATTAPVATCRPSEPHPAVLGCCRYQQLHLL